MKNAFKNIICEIVAILSRGGGGEMSLIGQLKTIYMQQPIKH